MHGEPKRTSVAITEGGYLDRLGHGKLSGYIRFLADARRQSVAEALDTLLAEYTEQEVVEMIPAFAYTNTTSYSPIQRRAGRVLWLETQFTGLRPSDLIALIRKGVAA
jgi:hypothetical protein